MRSSPGLFDLSFLLPKGVILRPGSEAGFAVQGCTLRVIRPLVKICGRSREAVFGVASFFLQTVERPPGPVAIAATLRSPQPASGSDSWTIIVGADVAFAPTGLGVAFPECAVA